MSPVSEARERVDLHLAAHGEVAVELRANQEEC